MNDPVRRVLLGRFHGAFGVRGEVRLESFTEPDTEIFRYQPWTLRDAQGRERELLGARGRPSPKGIVATVPGVEDRDAADALRGIEVWVARSALPPPRPGEFYWVDLEGLRVSNLEGVPFGTVSHVFSTGANDVLVVRDDARERMIPWARPDYVREVDLAAGTILVDWDPEF
ncbi:ribosome maturation factor RimM [Luteimonas sp. Y-2-2-4F]|nr:ribosome maturation factor RimM [Luteimonas sp. Y-2-2-4F]MCD9031593.1 ribosome maturation factor RimM [Luteimonas sp. Y-2-2-4F]MCD9031832.1 ribosome maturation factor RimM [Luteimonas sp. Y-2-2-4F]